MGIVLVQDDEKVLVKDSDNGYTTLSMYLMPPNCILMNTYDDYLCVYDHNKKKKNQEE